MSNILLSICISSYNHGDKCARLVNRILSIRDERYDIVICDDCSGEETIAELKKLSNHKITFIYNERNLGSCPNWFKTIDSGTGKYILHVLDRDIIDPNYLPVILDALEKNTVGGGYFGKSMQYPVKGLIKKGAYSICKKGREAFLVMAGVPIHPTGFFVKRTVWKKGHFRKFFYQTSKYGIYPHSYVLGKIAVGMDMIYSPIPFYDFIYTGSNKVSGFYGKNCKKGYWWMPDSVIKTHNCLMLYLSAVADESYKKEFICRRFNDALYRATLLYKKTVENQMEMEHYGFQAGYVFQWELLWISVKYKISFLYMLSKMNTVGADMYKQLRNIWISNLKAIMKNATEKDADKVLSVCNKNLVQFYVMSQWVKLKQEKNNLSVYFEEREYKSIAIYGMGKIGQMLLEELKETDIEVAYGIDQNAETTYSTIDVLSLNDKLPQVDVIVVTVMDLFTRIEAGLKEKTDCPIVSLMDIVYDA